MYPYNQPYYWPQPQGQPPVYPPYGAPPMGAPPYGAPPVGAPAYGAPPMGAPAYGAPNTNFGAPAPVYPYGTAGFPAPVAPPPVGSRPPPVHPRPSQQPPYSPPPGRPPLSPRPPVSESASFERPRDLPQAVQSFGQGKFQFQYSQCTGRRKALIMGCNYTGLSSNIVLKGCVNDADNMKDFIMKHFGYKEENIVFLTDDHKSPSRRPTKENMLRAMQWLVKDAQPNDSLFFHWSGHGGVVEDRDGDEDDGYDSTIFPLDFQQAGVIIDDTMHDIMVKPLPMGCRLTALYDCCHSGTALDLPYIYSTKGVVKEPNILKYFGSDGLEMFKHYNKGDIQKTIQTGISLFNKVSKTKTKEERENIKRLKASSADVVSISGCKDDQVSTDAKINGQSTGAMTYAFISVLNSQPQQSYISLLNNMRNSLRGKYDQKPQLSSSHPIDVQVKFIM